MKSDVAVLSKVKEFSLFKNTGADVFFVEKDEDALVIFKKIVQTYKIVFVAETLAEMFQEELGRFDEKPFPIVCVLPENNKTSGFALKNLIKKSKQAVGLDIFKERE